MLSMAWAVLQGCALAHGAPLDAATELRCGAEIC